MQEVELKVLRKGFAKVKTLNEIIEILKKNNEEQLTRFLIYKPPNLQLRWYILIKGKSCK